MMQKNNNNQDIKIDTQKEQIETKTGNDTETKAGRSSVNNCVSIHVWNIKLFD